MTGTGLRGFGLKVGKHGGKQTDITICIVNILAKSWESLWLARRHYGDFGLRPKHRVEGMGGEFFLNLGGMAGG